ncbi:MAG: metal-sulfur cluster assembly factor [Cytophagaceae bacterium]
MNDLERINQLLNEVLDPELGIGVVDLGLIYEVLILNNPSKIKISMTLTTPNCPLSEYFPDAVQKKLGADYPTYLVEVEIVWTPEWTPKYISENGRKLLGMK